MILNATKGIALVAIARKCTQKYMALLNDQEVYQECKDQAKNIHAKVLQQLFEL